MLNRDNIFQASAPKTEVLEIPEWDDSVTIRALSSEQANALAESTDEQNAVARWIAASVVGDDGQLLFTEDDLPKIRAMGARGILRLHRAIEKINGLGGDTEKN